MGLFFLRDGREALFQIDLVGDGDDGGAEHEFLVGGVHTHAVDFRFQSEHIVQNVLKFIPQVFVSPLCGVGALLQPDEQGQIVQAQHILCQGDEQQVGDLIPAVLLLHRIGYQPFLYIVADHGAGDGVVLNGSQIFADVFGCLLQVKTHIGDLAVAGELEVLDAGGNPVFGFLFHKISPQVL